MNFTTESFVTEIVHSKYKRLILTQHDNKIIGFTLVVLFVI